MATVKTGIIGCGGIARRHAAAYATLPQAQLVAVCDALPERAQQFAELYGATAYSDPATMLRESGVQAVSIWHAASVAPAAAGTGGRARRPRHHRETDGHHLGRVRPRHCRRPEGGNQTGGHIPEALLAGFAAPARCY